MPFMPIFLEIVLRMGSSRAEFAAKYKALAAMAWRNKPRGIAELF
jgi:hypothetical protein